MKADFVHTLQCCLLLLLTSLATGCYSVQFEPATDYPVLKRVIESDAEIELRSAPPRRPYDRLGALTVHDAALDLQDRTFRNFLKEEIRRRGARGGFIQYRGRRYADGMQSGVRDQRYDYTPTGSMQVDVYELRLILYNYNQESHDQDQSAD